MESALRAITTRLTSLIINVTGPSANVLKEMMLSKGHFGAKVKAPQIFLSAWEGKKKPFPFDLQLAHCVLLERSKNTYFFLPCIMFSILTIKNSASDQIGTGIGKKNTWEVKSLGNCSVSKRFFPRKQKKKKEKKKRKQLSVPILKPSATKVDNCVWSGTPEPLHKRNNDEKKKRRSAFFPLLIHINRTVSGSTVALMLADKV